VLGQFLLIHPATNFGSNLTAVPTLKLGRRPSRASLRIIVGVTLNLFARSSAVSA
jgi:hypothetical protein